jgi:CubicO group peptidase (beta-lactamase class C family)
MRSPNLARAGLAPCLTISLILGAGCPADDTVVGDGTGGDETGGPGAPEPLDPFDGEGSDPPGDPLPHLTYRSPSSLGNGLVHDSRWDLGAGSYERDVSALQLAVGVDWASFVASHAEKVRVGFRPAQVEAEIAVTPHRDGSVRLHLTDRSVYLSDDDANYRTVTKTYLFSDLAFEQVLAASGPSAPGSPRPTSIDYFAANASSFGAHIVWTYDNSPVDWELVVGQTEEDFLGTVLSLGDAGYRPISVSSRQRDGVGEYAGIFVQDGSEDWLAMLGRSAAELDDETASAWADGYYPFRRSFRQGSDDLPRFDVLWVKRSPKLKLEMRYNMDDVLFEQLDQDFRGRGYHLESASAYVDAGVERLAALWVRHDPYLRWKEGIPIDPTDPTYVARYLPLHDQQIQQMTLAGDGKEGEFIRPSGTLHIFEGADLVLSRAYTYAPAIYPDTPLDAPMALASVSKAITAAAVVRQLNIENIPLTTPFAGLAGINNVPTMAQAPSVLDVLRNLGGFEALATSYSDHALIDQSIYGAYPITGEMMYDYVVLGGHLDNGGLDSYWNLGTYTMDQISGVLRYSNPGYSMLGELVRVRSGLSYQDYVRTNLLTPLNLQQEIYPDPGHRNAHDVPTKSSLRGYLINTGHRYNVIGCDTDSDCNYLACPNCPAPSCGPDATCLGCSQVQPCEPGWTCSAGECINLETPLLESEPPPKPASNGDGSLAWHVNAGPIDSSAPATAASERYAGERYLGGAPLAAGGWYADGESLGVLLRVLAQGSFLMPQAVAAQLWNPLWWNPNHNRGPGWSYGLGFWLRGNWVAMAGGMPGSGALAAHNLAYDFTVVSLTNLQGNGLVDLLNPLMTPVNGVWGTSTLGSQFPCIDDPGTPQNECQNALAAY